MEDGIRSRYTCPPAHIHAHTHTHTQWKNTMCHPTARQHVQTHNTTLISQVSFPPPPCQRRMTLLLHHNTDRSISQPVNPQPPLLRHKVESYLIVGSCMYSWPVMQFEVLIGNGKDAQAVLFLVYLGCLGCGLFVREKRFRGVFLLFEDM